MYSIPFNIQSVLKNNTLSVFKVLYVQILLSLQPCEVGQYYFHIADEGVKLREDHLPKAT